VKQSRIWTLVDSDSDCKALMIAVKGMLKS
jgi:hypothetical protein